MEIIGIIIGAIIALILLVILITWVFVMVVGYKIKKRGENLLIKNLEKHLNK